MVVPVGPCAVSLTQPTMFWPMSATVSPAGVLKILTGFSSWILRTGGPAEATRSSLRWLTTWTADHPRSSNPGAVHPGFSRRASYVSP